MIINIIIFIVAIIIIITSLKLFKLFVMSSYFYKYFSLNAYKYVPINECILLYLLLVVILLLFNFVIITISTVITSIFSPAYYSYLYCYS